MVQSLGVQADVIERIHGKLQNMTADQKKAYDELLVQSAKATQAWNDLGVAASTAGDKMLSAFGPELTGFIKSTATDVEGILKLFDKIEAFVGGSSGKVL